MSFVYDSIDSIVLTLHEGSGDAIFFSVHPEPRTTMIASLQKETPHPVGWSTRPKHETFPGGITFVKLYPIELSLHL